MLTLTTNRQEYQNDIAETIRAFLKTVQIQLGSWDSAQGFAIKAFIDNGKSRAVAFGRKNPYSEIKSYEYPIKESASHLTKKRFEKRALKTAVFRVMRQLEPEIVLPWGSLTGIRPTKLLRELLIEHGAVEARRIFIEEFDVLEHKTELALNILHTQKELLDDIDKNDINLYINIPFCKTKCLYCSFASQALGDSQVPQDYLNALNYEIKSGAECISELGYKLRSIYIGGGTPTVLSAEQLEKLLEHVFNCYGGFGKELTIEAGRPDSIDIHKLRIIKNFNATRISLNPQSMNLNTLKKIGRMHTPKDIVNAFNMARELGFNNINMDIIAGLPDETVGDMDYTLKEIAALKPESLTVHTLALKRASLLKERLNSYNLPVPAQVEAMTALSAQYAKELLMHPYYMYRQKYMSGNLENIGYSVHKKECLYNIDMMEDAASIFALGAGAMTKRVFNGSSQRIERIPAPKDIKTYIDKLPILLERKRDLFFNN